MNDFLLIPILILGLPGLSAFATYYLKKFQRKKKRREFLDACLREHYLFSLTDKTKYKDGEIPLYIDENGDIVGEC